MPTFKDSTNREWLIKLNVDLIEKVRIFNGVDLVDITAASMKRLRVDEVLLVRTLWQLCEPQADKAGVTPEQFGESLFGDALDRGFEAVRGAVDDFFPSTKRDLWRRMMAVEAKQEAEALSIAIENLESPEVIAQTSEAMRTRIKSELDAALIRLRSVIASPDSAG